MKIVILESQFNSLFEGKRVMVYYNLHKHTFSISYSGKIIMYADMVKLDDVEFRVREGGRERVRGEKRKNVHAFVIGNLIDYCEHPCSEFSEPEFGEKVTYNPYKHESFVLKNTEEPIFNADEVLLVNSKNKIFVVS